MRTLVTLATLGLLVATPCLAKESVRSLQKRYAIALAQGDVDGVRMALEDLGAFDDKKAAKTLLKLALNPRADRATFEGAKAGLANVTNEDGLEELIEIAERQKGPWEPRALVAEAFGGISSPKVIPPLVQLLEDPSPVVQRKAVIACATKQDPKVLRALITLYKKNEEGRGRVFMACRQSLKDLTGLGYITGAEWESFYDRQGEGFDYENDYGKMDEAAAASISRAEAEMKKERAELFGAEIQSSQVVFVIDTSGSMEMLWEDSPEFPKEKHEHGKAPEERLRITRTKAELKRMIGTLQPYIEFTVVSFSDTAKLWERELVPATPDNIQKAQAFVDRLRAQGGTNTQVALQEAFQFPDCDMIYLLSDGAPSKYGEDKRDAKFREEILQESWETNRFREVVIHSVCFDGPGIWQKRRGERPDSLAPEKVAEFIQFMRSLAADHNGTYTSIP